MAEPGCHRVEHVMGTAISVDVRDAGVGPGELDDIFRWFRYVDETFSTYQDSSQISRLGRGEVAVADCDPEVGRVLERCDQVGRASGGYFDIRATGVLDPSGLVKGWSVELASAMLVERGALNHCINAGGDIRIRGEPAPGRPWRVGIVHPLEPRSLTVVVEGHHLAVATSGVAERGRHVSDPHTGRAADALASVTLVGPELTLTDAYATAALAMGLAAPAWLAGLADHEAYIVDAGGHVWWTAGFARYAPALATTPVPRLSMIPNSVRRALCGNRAERGRESPL
jgi:thiamine biosynthesis lipoprotein